MKTFLKDQCEFLSTASFTIEATVIFPLILFILFSLLHLTFTLHDAAVAKAVSYRSLISQSTQKQPLYHSAGNSSDYFFILNTSNIFSSSCKLILFFYLTYVCNRYKIPLLRSILLPTPKIGVVSSVSLLSTIHRSLVLSGYITLILEP